MKNYIFALLVALLSVTLIFSACDKNSDADAVETKNDVTTDVMPDITDSEDSTENTDGIVQEDNEKSADTEDTSESDTEVNDDVIAEADKVLPEENNDVILEENMNDEAEEQNPVITDSQITDKTEQSLTVSNANIEVIDGITYVDGILIVNKTYSLPSDYAPEYPKEVLDSLSRMFADANATGYTLKTKSGYRSYIDQKIIYNNYVAKDGKALADTYSARPGHSEHQSALAFDLNKLSKSFGSSPEGIWLAQNCHKYGFIIRYPEGKEHITGYMYEPWHVRYLGVELATEVYQSGLCLEEFLGITSAYSY